MSVYEKMTAIADAIRDKTGEVEKLGLDAMVDGVDKVHKAGKQAEYDRFWDSYQNNGNRSDYQYAFAGWKDAVFKPKYNIVLGAGYTGTNMFWGCGVGNIAEALEGQGVILDTTMCGYFSSMFQNAKTVRIPVLNCTHAMDYNTNGLQATFLSSTVETIDKLIVPEVLKYTSTFQGCTNLKNITFEGTIGRDINMQWCPLTPESAWSVVQHLKCFEAYPDPEGDINPDFMKYTVTFSSAVWAALDEYTRENELHGWGTVKDYIENDIGWRTA